MRFLLIFFISPFLMLACQSTQVNPQEPIEGQAFYKMKIIRIALDQSETPSPAWEPQQRDCAGFVRFVYRNAVNDKNPMWLSWQDEKTNFATAELLVTKNFTKISDEIGDTAKTGDILVFHREDQKKEDQWHLMILMESPWEQNKWLVTYHNGAHDETGGVKKLWLNDLINAPQENWKPIKDNRNYVGVYRWNKWVK